MSSSWRIVPTYSYWPSRSSAARRAARDRYFDELYRPSQWDVRPGRYEQLSDRGFDDGLRRQWEDFSLDSFGTELERDRDAPSKVVRVQSSQGFEVSLDMRGFSQEEISVKITGNTMRVEGKHQSETGDGHVKKSFAREFILPEDIDLDALKSSLGPDGMLSVTAPRRGPQERAVPIAVTRDELPGKAVGAASGVSKK